MPNEDWTPSYIHVRSTLDMGIHTGYVDHDQENDRMHAHLLRLIRTGLTNPYTLHAFTFILWLAFVWVAYHQQSWIAAIAIGPAFHLFMMVNHRMCEAGYYGDNPFARRDNARGKGDRK